MGTSGSSRGAPESWDVVRTTMTNFGKELRAASRDLDDLDDEQLGIVNEPSAVDKSSMRSRSGVRSSIAAVPGFESMRAGTREEEEDDALWHGRRCCCSRLLSTSAPEASFEGHKRSKEHIPFLSRVIDPQSGLARYANGGCYQTVLALPTHPHLPSCSVWMNVVLLCTVWQLYGLTLRGVFIANWAFVTATLYFADVVFVLDILVRLRTGYMDSGNKIMVPARIRRQYLRSWHFVVDFVAALPLDPVLMVCVPSDQWLNISTFLRLLKLLRLVYVPGWLSAQEALIVVSWRPLVRSLITILYGFTLAHLVGSVWLALPPPDSDDAMAFMAAPHSVRGMTNGWSKYLRAIYWGMPSTCRHLQLLPTMPP